MNFDSAPVINKQEQKPKVPSVEKTFDRETALREFETILKSPDADVLYFLDGAVVALSSGNESVKDTLEKNGYENMNDLWKKVKSYEEKYGLNLDLASDVTNLRHDFQARDFLRVQTKARDLAAKIRNMQESGNFLKG